MNDKKTFVFHAEWKEILKNYPAELRLELYEAIVDYAIGNDVELSQNASLIFPFIKCKLDGNRNAYFAKCETLKANGSRGGRPKKETKKNQTKPNGFSKTKSEEKNQIDANGFSKTKSAIDYDNDNELLSNSNELSNNKEKNNNIIIIKKENFDSHFRELAMPIWKGIECEAWREIMGMKHGIEDWGQAILDFKNHIITQGNEARVLDFSKSEELKRYMANALNVKNRDGKNFLSDKAKQKPKQNQRFKYLQEHQLDESRWRKPCERLENREVEAYGKKVIVGVVMQDGKEYYCSPQLPAPPDRFHYYNPLRELYEDTLAYNPGQDIDKAPQGLLSLSADYYIGQHEDYYKPQTLDF